MDVSRHVVVELLVESYAARMTHTLNNLIFQQLKVKSRQEVAEFSVQMQRNRILRMNLHCGIAGVSIGLCTVVSSLFGMNITLPHVPEIFPEALGSWLSGPFGTVFGFSLVVPTVVYLGSYQYLKGNNLKAAERRRSEQRSMLKAVFSDIGAVDYAVRESFSAMTDEDESSSKQDTTRESDEATEAGASRYSSPDGDQGSQASAKAESDRLKRDLWRRGRRVTKIDFANYMRVARGGKEVDNRAVDMFFDILDSDKDGFLSMTETNVDDEKVEGDHFLVGDANTPVVPNKIGSLSENLRKPF